jgi:hypothetical protein
MVPLTNLKVIFAGLMIHIIATITDLKAIFQVYSSLVRQRGLGLLKELKCHPFVTAFHAI